MADDSELDYIRTFLQYACPYSTVKHFSEVKKTSAINDTRRILVYPGELIGVDGKFYKKRYKIKISDTSEASLMEIFNSIMEAIHDLSRGQEATAYYTGTHFDISGEHGSPVSIIWDGTYFWVVGGTDVFKYNAAGVYQTVSIDVSGEITTAFGVCWDGTSFWVVGTTNLRVYKYNAAGVYQTSSFDISGEITTASGICWDGTSFWVIGVGNLSIYKYNAAGVYQSVSIDVSGETVGPSGITWDGTYFWVVDTSSNKIYRYKSNGEYTEVYIDVSDEELSPRDAAWESTYIWLVGNFTDEVYKYNNYIYSKPNVLCYINMTYGNKAYEVGITKRWNQDIYLDVEWCTA